MANEDYEILPHQLLSDLKGDVEALKKKLSRPDSKANELILEIESMKDSVHDLNELFNKALEDQKEEDIYLSIKKLNARIDDVVGQNETIANGMIAISDKLEEFMGKHKETLPPVRSNSEMGPGPSRMPPSGQHTMGPPQMGGPGKVAPPPGMPQMPTEPVNASPGGLDLPPPPPNMGKKGKVKIGIFR